MKTISPQWLSPQWFCDNSCAWTHDVRFEHSVCCGFADHLWPLVYIYIYMYMYICIYIYIYIYIHRVVILNTHFHICFNILSLSVYSYIATRFTARYLLQFSMQKLLVIVRN